MYIAPLIHIDQIKEGDTLVIETEDAVFAVKAHQVIDVSNGLNNVIVINKKGTQDFSTLTYLDGQSWVKDCLVCRKESP